MILSKPQRDLLKQLVFRWPHPCYLVITGRGHHALVVTTMMRSRQLQRMPHAFLRSTTIGLSDAGLISLEERFGDIPRYGYLDTADTSHGWLVAITPRGREAIGALDEVQQRRAQQIAAAENTARTAAAVETMRRARVATRGTPEGSVDAAIDGLRGRCDHQG